MGAESKDFGLPMFSKDIFKFTHEFYKLVFMPGPALAAGCTISSPGDIMQRRPTAEQLLRYFRYVKWISLTADVAHKTTASFMLLYTFQGLLW